MVKPGYKQTELGLLPEEWACREIGSFADVCMCKRIFAEQTSEMGEIPFYKIGTFGKKADAYISRLLFEEYKQKYSYPQEGDVLISAAGTLGRTVVYDGEEAYFQDSNIVWLDIDKSQISNDYLYHYYKVIKWTPSEGSTIARLYNGIITSTNVAVPPKPEQKAIAEALSDIDTLIVNLEKLIAKKKAIKQGAMITLLRQYHTDKKSVKLKDLCAITTGKMDANAASESGKYKFFTCAREDSRIDEFAFEGDAILIAGNGDVGHSKLYSGRFNAYQRTYVLMDFMVSPYLLKQYIDDKLPKAILTDLQGGAMPYIKISTLAELTIDIPVSLEEQKHIETTLYDMETEIDILERNLEKYRFVKQGMMSELLTGRIRLIDKEDA